MNPVSAAAPGSSPRAGASKTNVVVAARRPSDNHHHHQHGDQTMTTTTIDHNGLEQGLRALKLGGMLSTLDARLAQARAGELGHLDFLTVLCQDEISRRETMSMQRRIRKARFEQQATLEGFDYGASPKLPAAQIRDLAALRWLHAGECVILYGPVGVGKSHIAQALGHLAIRHGADVRFIKTSRALADLAGGHADHSWQRRLGELARPAVLILDDFAMRELTPAQADDLYELISERTGRSMILTSNRAPQDWYPLFPNPVVAESLLDRLINNSHQVFMNGPSYRPNNRPGRVIPPDTKTTR
jgi:DNA replication protein DnaC